MNGLAFKKITMFLLTIRYYKQKRMVYLRRGYKDEEILKVN